MSEKKSTELKIHATKDYRLFHRSPDNRPTDVRRRKKLRASMEQYGWLSCSPMVCVRDDAKRLIVKDGQHRLEIAESLGLVVYWVEHPDDFNVAITAAGQKPWIPMDFAQCFAAKGVKPYQHGLEFAEQYKLPVGIAFALLAGTTSYGNIETEFIVGKFSAKDPKWANDVACVYSQMLALEGGLRTSIFISACMAACRVAYFDPKRLIHSAKRCRDKLLSYSTRDACLDMLEEVYNFGRKALSPLKIDAMNAMRERCAVGKIGQINRKKKEEDARD
jgi:hypothetical protein